VSSSPIEPPFDSRWIKGAYKGVYTEMREDGPWTHLEVRDALADIEARRSDDRCEHGWGDFRCTWTSGHDGPHSLAWDGDEDDE
jgi:hypothetical protein